MPKFRLSDADTIMMFVFVIFGWMFIFPLFLMGCIENYGPLVVCGLFGMMMVVWMTLLIVWPRLTLWYMVQKANGVISDYRSGKATILENGEVKIDESI